MKTILKYILEILLSFPNVGISSFNEYLKIKIPEMNKQLDNK